jgi:hypothetical protein
MSKRVAWLRWGAVLSLFAPAAMAAGPTCNAAANETLLSWPAVDPVWQMCWVPVQSSVGPRGSGLELRSVYYKGTLVLKRAHSPLLFAEYRDGAGGNCYRDWKDDPSSFIAAVSMRNQLGTGTPAPTTNCDRSASPTTSYGTCPYQLPGMNASNCFQGVAIQDNGDHVTITTEYDASWYAYASRFTFYANGSIEPQFGFGNNNGTYNNVTHWHHNYWRLDFDIDGPGGDTVYEGSTLKSTEFSAVRDTSGRQSWSVMDGPPDARFGYRLSPGPLDAEIAANESGRGFHTVDLMATEWINNEYGDSASNNLSNCQMNQNALVNGASLVSKDVVLYYRVSVRDATANNWPTSQNAIPQDSMICKKRGPLLELIGELPLFRNGAE